MQIIATQLTTREAPRKVRLVADVVRKLSPEAAVKQLLVVERRAGEVILKVLNSALANAAHNHNLQPSELVIENITVNEGPRFKRYQPVSRGRAHNIVKRTSHIKVVLVPKSVDATASVSDKPVVKTTKPAAKTTKPTTKTNKSNKKTNRQESKNVKV